MKLILIFLNISFATFNLYANQLELRSFESDGCTMFIDGPPANPGLWRPCCLQHDLRYWFGGDQIDLDQADLRLKSCVLKLAGNTWAELIYTGVRLGHHAPVKNKTHWSWGWVPGRQNIKLTKPEIEYIKIELKRLPIDSIVIENFININFPDSYVKI